MSELHSTSGSDGGSRTAAKTETDDGLAGTIAKHYNDLQQTGIELRKDSRIFHLRNFNNWVKSVSLGDFIDELKKKDRSRQIKALDLCCGKGGDLRKWMYGKVEKVVFADIAGTSLEQCQARYEEMAAKNQRGRNQLFNAEFHCADCTRVRLKDLYKETDIKFDITSCQFSFHYSFESLPQVEMMLRNACECLKPGGYFIGTTPDSVELVKRLRAAPGMSFGNDVYGIKFLGDSKHDLPLFGCKYDFHLEGVVDCPEFLVYFPLLEELAKEYNMKLIYKKPFTEFFKEKYAVREHRQLLERMTALEPYPPARGNCPVSDNPASYAHAAEKLKELERDAASQPARLSTLSLEEWEAATIYLAFAFQKMADNPGQSQSSRRDEQPQQAAGSTAASAQPSIGAEQAVAPDESPAKKQKSS